MKRADAIPPNQSLKAQKRARVQESLQANGYPVTFISTTPRPKADQMESQPKPAGVAVIPYVQGVSDSETSPETKQRQSCFQAYDNTGFYLQKAEGSTTDGQSDGGSVQGGV